MATGTSFKQECPSCEALVPVKDVSLVGKKIECPKCKDKFIVKAPEAKTNGDAAQPAKTNAKAPAGKKPATRPAADDTEEAAKPAALAGKKKPGANRFTMAIALAVVGVVVLGAAGYFILFSKGKTPPTKAAKGVPRTAPAPLAKGEPKVAKNTGDVKDPAPVVTPVTPRTVELPSGPADLAELTNLLPSDTQHVVHVPFSALFDPTVSIADALFQTPGALKDEFLRGKLGFSLLAIDDLLHAERYGNDGWAFTVVHFHDALNQEAVIKALDLKPAPLVKKLTHYRVSTFNPWLAQLARFAIGVPHSVRLLPNSQARPLFVHFHDPRTLIFADEAPMVALLNQDKHFQGANGSGPSTATTASAGAEGTQAQTYSTIKPALKAMLTHMEEPKAGAKSKLLYCSATDLDAARLPGKPAPAPNKMLWYPRPVWDVTLLLSESNSRVLTLGVAIAQTDARGLQMRNQLECPADYDARALETELGEEAAPEMAHFIERLLGHKIELAKKDQPLLADPAKGPQSSRGNMARRPPRGTRLVPTKEKKVEQTNPSKITVVQNYKTVELTLDLHLDAPELGKLHTLAGLLGSDLSAAMEVAGRVMTRHDLARAAKLLPEKGLTERGVLPENYPPGAFPRSGTSSQRSNRSPMQRIGWMAGLLPFLGQESLYGKIHFNDSWRDSSNWGPASTLVPQFIDPAYPPSTHYLTRSDLPFELAATHFVGIAGVGLDAADYDPADPAMLPKRGVMGYDKGMSLEEVRKGHGLACTIVMVQVPPDSIVGVTPWIAGGGSTLRGVPEKNSVAPFVFNTTAADGKARRGTYALMADGSVRYIDESVSDQVFKALATAQQPLPEGFDPDSVESKTPLVPAPAASGRTGATGTTGPPAKKK